LNFGIERTRRLPNRIKHFGLNRNALDRKDLVMIAPANR
jgi:hypothetical protein